jgi:2-C-methyl-D-erythritol 4-phosphate cytidylyltransferase
MNIAVILSAGSGNRFKSDVPKQFLDLNGTPVISQSLIRFEEAKFIDSILIVAHPEHIKEVEELATGYKKVVTVIKGGSRRQDSVFNALKWINKNTEFTKVWIHDSARPLFSAELLERLNEKSLKVSAVIPVIASNDTLKKIDNGVVVSTLDRSTIYRVQTPQVFNFKILYEAYSKFSDTIDATDDAFLLERLGVKIFTVEGEANNIKLTYPIDIKIAELLMNASK